ncbi:oligosaccharide flippase family protein [Mycobacterium sp. CBMA247]|nr:oligosaccharide flippase family protein [Mycolicibacterium sp. CBMA 329]MUL87501.1 oligosaccharide flippase family protein [Mycolicibacterium sp. CBMA 331]MUL99634.1 oligosaccharide flippase family protein [Mycolicibacterium sp. CBMA 334]MUM26731.1 oligosaccharide flippase family protein [Mycolicibacterium sp. CBMA 295]MUM37798.1 oligosaccharide flippase family protein [Mycolicibacterium sp. CBMA 247]MUM43566.1 oligosaccharide flippase family protein [Mycolicibacterium sp. CBMA 294]
MARAFSQQLIFRALGMIASVLTVAATTRHLGPTGYGHLTTAVVFVGLWTSLTELGVGAVVVRRVTSGKGELSRLVRVNAGMSLLYCVPLFLIAATSGVLMYRGQDEVVRMVLIISCSLILTTITSCFEPVFLASVRFMAVAWSDLVSRIASLGATMLLIAMDANTVWFAVVQLIPPLVVLVIQGVAAARISDWRPVFSLSESWHLLRESLPQTGVLIIAVLYWRADGVILSLRSTPEQVGVYGLAYTLAFTLSVLSTFFQTSTLSAATHSFAVDRSEFARFVTRTVESMLFLGAPIAVVGIVVARPVVELVGSSEFGAHGGVTLALLLVAVTLTFLNAAISQALFAAHDQVFLFRLNLVNLVGNIVLNVVLTPSYGAMGAGAALIVAELTGLFVATWRLSRIAPYRTPWLFVLRLAIPLGAAAAVAISMQHASVLVTLPLSAVVYLGVNLVVGPVTPRVIRSTLADGDSPEMERQ